MLKLIEQFAKMIAKLLDTDFENEPQKFSIDFNSLLLDYFKIKPDELELLLVKDSDRDALLLDELSKNSQLSLFARSGWVFIKQNQNEKALICLKIIERIQLHHATLFEFPTQEYQKIEEEISKLKEALN